MLAREDELWLELERDALPALVAHLERYVIADDVTLRDVSEAWARAALEGPRAAELLAQAVGRAVAPPPDGVAELPDGAGLAAGYSRAGAGGVQLFVTAAAPALHAELARAGAVPGDADELEVLRIEDGVPRQGRELTLEVLPAEARLDRARLGDEGLLHGPGDRDAHALARPRRAPPRRAALRGRAARAGHRAEARGPQRRQRHERRPVAAPRSDRPRLRAPRGRGAGDEAGSAAGSARRSRRLKKGV